MIPGGPSDGEPPEDGLSPHEQRKAKRQANRLINRVVSYVQGYVMYVHTSACKVRKSKFESVYYRRAVTMAGLLVRSLETGTPIVIHLRNEAVDADKKDGVDVSPALVRAFRENGWAVIKGKHLIPISLLKRLAKVFPRAVDALAYLGGLCGPLWAGTYLRNCTVTVRTIRTKGRRAAGCDGSGRIHPKHPLYTQLDIAPADACTVQIRAMNLHEGLFMKGILVPDERCLDEEGNPDIWVDWLQIKGAHKAEAKVKAKLLDEDPMSTIEVDLGVTQIWNRGIRYSWNFEILGWIKNTPETRRDIDAIVSENIKAYIERGGDLSLFDQMCQDDENLAFMAKALEALNLSPKAVPDIRQRLDKQASAFRHLCVQGAGKKSLSWVAVIDNGVPPGHAVVRPMQIDGEWRYTPGMEVALTRMPIVLPQGLRTVKLIDPAKTGLDHLLISDNRGGKHVPMWTVYLNEVDLVEGLMGDDDGDVVIIDDDPRAVRLFKNSITFPGFTRSHRFLIEPEEAEGFQKSAVLTDTEAGMDIVAHDGRGPVGKATIWQFCFMKLGKPWLALASGVLVQEFIDMAKRVVHHTDPRHALDPRKWVEANDGTVRLADGCKFAPESAYVNEYGSIDMDMLGEWIKNQMGWAKTKVLLPWRPDKRKQLPLSQCEEIVKHFDGDINNAKTLLDHCAFRASWLLLEADRLSEPEEVVDLSSFLPKLISDALGVEVRIPHLDPDSYNMGLLKESGLSEYGKTLRQICEPHGLYTHSERDVMIEAARMQLVEKLKHLANPRSENYDMELTMKLLQIWVVETTLRPPGHEYYESSIKRAFRAILWEGSPILKIVDPDGEGIKGAGCSFMTPQRLKATMQYLHKLSNTQSGREEMLQLIPTAKPSIFLATQVGIQRSVRHEAEMGLPLSECSHCVRAISGQVVGDQRSDRTGEAQAIVKQLVTDTKASLGWPRTYSKKH